MSEEEIIDEINFCNEGEYITREHYQAIQGLLDLYNKEKEKNKELFNCYNDRVSDIIRLEQTLEEIDEIIYSSKEDLEIILTIKKILDEREE